MRINRSCLPADLDVFVNDLIEKGYFGRTDDGQFGTSNRNTGWDQDMAGQCRSTGLGSFMRKRGRRCRAAKSLSEVTFFEVFRHSLSTALFLERRLKLTEPVRRFDYEQGVPQNDLQALLFDDAAQQALAKEIRSTFSIGVWVDDKSNEVCLRVNQAGNVAIGRGEIATSCNGEVSVDRHRRRRRQVVCGDVRGAAFWAMPNSAH